MHVAICPKCPIKRVQIRKKGVASFPSGAICRPKYSPMVTRRPQLAPLPARSAAVRRPVRLSPEACTASGSGPSGGSSPAPGDWVTHVERLPSRKAYGSRWGLQNTLTNSLFGVTFVSGELYVPRANPLSICVSAGLARRLLTKLGHSRSSKVPALDFCWSNRRLKLVFVVSPTLWM